MLPGLLLLAFVVFFVLPVIWLLLAATKTDAAARPGQPALLRVLARAAGELGRADRLPGRRDPAVAAQLGALRVPRPGDHPGRGHTGRLRPGDDGVPRAARSAGHHAGGHAHAGHDPGRAAVPRDQRGAPGRVAVVGGAAVLVLPVRRLPDLYLLQHRAAPRPAGRGPHRRLHGVRGVPPHRAAAGRPDHRAGGVLQLRGELDQLLPALRDAAAKQPVPGPGRPGAAADRRPAVQPDRGHRRRAAARTRPGHPRWRSARCCSCSCSPSAT